MMEQVQFYYQNFARQIICYDDPFEQNNFRGRHGYQDYLISQPPFKDGKAVWLSKGCGNSVCFTGIEII